MDESIEIVELVAELLVDLLFVSRFSLHLGQLLAGLYLELSLHHLLLFIEVFDFICQSLQLLFFHLLFCLDPHGLTPFTLHLVQIIKQIVLL